MFNLITWIVTLLSIIGAILNAQKKISGFYFWIVANSCWIIVDIHEGIYAQAGLFLFYVAVCIYGVHTWRKKEEELLEAEH